MKAQFYGYKRTFQIYLTLLETNKQKEIGSTTFQPHRKHKFRLNILLYQRNTKFLASSKRE